MGRPTKYKPEQLSLVKNVCQVMGATDQEVSEILEVSIATIYRWKVDHPEFRDALKLGKEIADQRVEQSLYQRAMGYSHPETKVFCNNGEITTEEVIKHYPPDSTSCIFWLKNRMPEEWRDKQELDVLLPMDDKERMEKVDALLMRVLERNKPEQKLDS